MKTQDYVKMEQRLRDAEAEVARLRELYNADYEKWVIERNGLKSEVARLRSEMAKLLDEQTNDEDIDYKAEVARLRDAEAELFKLKLERQNGTDQEWRELADAVQQLQEARAAARALVKYVPKYKGWKPEELKRWPWLEDSNG